MKKRLISSVLVLVLAISALVGCGQSKQENSTEQTSAEAKGTENGDSSSVPTGHTATEVNVGYVDVTGGSGICVFPHLSVQTVSDTGDVH